MLASEQQLEQLIDALLALAEGEQTSSRRAQIDLGTVAARALDDHAAQLDGRDLRVDAALEPTVVTGDPRLVERLVDNLVDNAIRHNQQGGRIEIRTADGVLSVANGGRAISPERARADHAAVRSRRRRTAGQRRRPRAGAIDRPRDRRRARRRWLLAGIHLSPIGGPPSFTRAAEQTAGERTPPSGASGR